MKNLFFFCLIGLFISCNKNDSDEIKDTTLVPVQFSSATQSTRTTDGGDKWVAGDSIGIFMVKTGTTTISDNVINYRYDATTTSSANKSGFAPAANADTIYYPMDDTKVDFIAYYPYRNAQTLTNYSIDLSNQSDPAAIDLLYGSSAVSYSEGYCKSDALNDTNLLVSLSLEHMLSKLELTVTKGAGVTDLTELTNVIITDVDTAANLNLATGILQTVTTSDGDINTLMTTTPTATVDGAYEAILLPVSSTTGVKVSFVLNGETYVWDLSNEITSFVAGKKYVYTISLNKTGVTVEGTIEPWIVESGSGEAF
ncbi:MAG: fimbrillin family protein [Culturomica sp.]|jgi:endonuclease G|nr:fimbrillin family protein [Culturomica sp.]